MIARISGILLEKHPTELVIDCNGVGYHLFVSTKTSEELKGVGEKVSLPAILISREDSLTLYGFNDINEKALFALLTSVSGIGPKTAIGILSGVTALELRDHVLNDDIKALSKLPGIGKKTAERLRLELKDKILSIVGDSGSSPNSLIQREAVSALLTLGYNKSLAEKAVKSATDELSKDTLSAEELIKIALKFALK